MKAEVALALIIDEYKKASEKFEKFHSPHEGIAVIKEEYDELWDEIKKKANNRDIAKLRKEAMQVAAMGLRFMVDLT